MATTASGGHLVGWPSRLAKARLHFVTGKGGTGKSTVAAALALTLAAGGRKVLLVEVEERQGIAQLFDVPPLPYKEQKIATAEGGGVVNALAIDIEAAFLEYLDMFYRLGLAGQAMRRIGAIEFATTIAPGLRDVLLTGKIREIVTRTENDHKQRYDAIVVDSPPTGRISRFLDVTKAVSELAKGGPVHAQAESVVNILHSENTAIHLVTLLESLPIQETIEAIEELRELDLPIGSVIVNRNIPAYLSADDLTKAAEGVVDADAVRAGHDALVQLGKAKRGDKTMLDALGPFVDSFDEYINDGKDWRTAWLGSVETAEKAAAQTAELLPKIGRARPLALRPGATPAAATTATTTSIAPCASSWSKTIAR